MKRLVFRTNVSTRFLNHAGTYEGKYLLWEDLGALTINRGLNIISRDKCSTTPSRTDSQETSLSVPHQADAASNAMSTSTGHTHFKSFKLLGVGEREIRLSGASERMFTGKYGQCRISLSLAELHPPSKARSSGCLALPSPAIKKVRKRHAVLPFYRNEGHAHNIATHSPSTSPLWTVCRKQHTIRRHGGWMFVQIDLSGRMQNASHWTDAVKERVYVFETYFQSEVSPEHSVDVVESAPRNGAWRHNAASRLGRSIVPSFHGMDPYQRPQDPTVPDLHTGEDTRRVSSGRCFKRHDVDSRGTRLLQRKIPDLKSTS